MHSRTTPGQLAAFRSIRCLLAAESYSWRKDVVYRSYEELSVAFANKGISLEAIEQLKRLNITRPPRPPKLIEHDPKR
jgi:hypothetical protein